MYNPKEGQELGQELHGEAKASKTWKIKYKDANGTVVTQICRTIQETRAIQNDSEVQVIELIELHDGKQLLME